MTVVLASIAERGNAIIMASDRMLVMPELTYQFEHDSLKLREIRGYIVGYAGTSTFADDILSHDLSDQPKSMKEFIKELADFYIKYGNRIAERVLLESLGLTLETFNANSQNYPESVRERVYQQLTQEKLNVEFIVCGYDNNQAKIYNIGDYGIYSTAHSIGYSAIGIGETHATSFYMVHGFKFATPLREAIFFAFRAKKSAEIAAGVGKCTDICVLEKNKTPVFYRDGCSLISGLNSIYDMYQREQETLHNKTVVPELRKLSMEVCDEDN